jgi:hypothetical protein
MRHTIITIVETTAPIELHLLFTLEVSRIASVVIQAGIMIALVL